MTWVQILNLIHPHLLFNIRLLFFHLFCSMTVYMLLCTLSQSIIITSDKYNCSYKFCIENFCLVLLNKVHLCVLFSIKLVWTTYKYTDTSWVHKSCNDKQLHAEERTVWLGRLKKEMKKKNSLQEFKVKRCEKNKQFIIKSIFVLYRVSCSSFGCTFFP